MTRPVVWVGTAQTPALAVPCGTCGVTIGAECVGRVFPLPHRARGEYAEVLGFRVTEQPGPLFQGSGP